MATRRDAGSELSFAVELMNRITEGVDGIRTGVHICRGNWSKKDSVHLAGDYAPLVSPLLLMGGWAWLWKYARALDFSRLAIAFLGWAFFVSPVLFPWYLVVLLQPKPMKV